MSAEDPKRMALLADIESIVKKAIKAERQRLADIFRQAKAGYNSVNATGEEAFDFEQSCVRIADAIEDDEPVIFGTKRPS